MQLVHHVIVTTHERLIDPGGLQHGQLESPYKVLTTNSIGNKFHIHIYKAHRKRAAGYMVGTQVAFELHVKPTDGFVAVLATWNSAHWVDLRRRVRTVIQVHHGKAETGAVTHRLIESLQQQDERIVRYG